jgi:hypothetical protein
MEIAFYILRYKKGKERYSRESYPSFLPLYRQISTALIELSTGRKGELRVLEREEQDRVSIVLEDIEKPDDFEERVD